MTRRSKGSVMILAIAVISMLLILAITILAFSSANRLITARYKSTDDVKMIAQTGADYGLAILKEKFVENINSNSEYNSAIYKIADNQSISVVSEIGLGASTNFVDPLPVDYPTSFSIAFNINGQSADGNPIKEGDCYIQYIDNETINKNTNKDEGSGVPNELKENLNSYLDPNDNLEKRCIKMTVIAVGKDKQLRRIDAYIDKSSISNYYLEKMTNNTFTIINKTTNESQAQLVLKDTLKPRISGDIYFRGTKLVTPSSISSDFNSKIQAYEHNPKEPYSRTYNVYQSVTEGGIRILKKLTVPDTFYDYYEPLDDGSGYTAVQSAKEMLDNNRYTVLKAITTSDKIISGSSVITPLPFALIAKCRPDVEEGKTSVDFNEILFGNQDASYVNDAGTTIAAIKYNHVGYRPSTFNGLRYFIKNGTEGGAKIFDFVDDSSFAKMYKFIVVYGDLNIDSSTDVYDGLLEEGMGPPSNRATFYRNMTYVNYVIICLGTVNIKGDFKLQNSSIFAKNITIEDTKANNEVHVIPDPTDDSKDEISDLPEDTVIQTSITVNGIGKPESIAAIKENLNNYYDYTPNNAWGFLDNVSRSLLNAYMTKNLPKQYATGLKFKVIDWKEK